MKPKAQIIAIAEACGYDLEKYRTYDMSINYVALPKYTTDLNAMHEAWCHLDAEQHKLFRHNLQGIAIRDGRICGPCASVCNTTASQRAEAFLRTIGKWKVEG